MGQIILAEYMELAHVYGYSALLDNTARLDRPLIRLTRASIVLPVRLLHQLA
jgi:hypothetical protein